MDKEIKTATIVVKEITAKITKGGTKKKDGSISQPTPYQAVKDTEGKTYNLMNGKLELGKTYNIEYHTTEYKGKDGALIHSKWISKVLDVREMFDTPEEQPEGNPESIGGVSNCVLTINPEIAEIKHKLQTLPGIYETRAVEVARKEMAFKKAEAEYENKEAKYYLQEKVSNPDDVATTIKFRVLDKLAEDKIHLIGLEADYKHYKALLEGVDKQIQLTRNQVDLFVAELYVFKSMEDISSRTAKP